MKVVRRPDMKIVGELPEGAEVLDLHTTADGNVVVATTHGAFMINEEGVMTPIVTQEPGPDDRLLGVMISMRDKWFPDAVKARSDYERSVRRRDAMIAHILGEPEPKLPEARFRRITPIAKPTTTE